MSKKYIVTAGEKAADIDVFGCAIAYAELLRLEGNDAVPVIAGTFTASVTPSILEWGAEYQTTYTSEGDEQFVIVDLSDPDHIPRFVDRTRVYEVYDHRSGYESNWTSLGDRSHIELVGSCGTLIWEQFKKRGLQTQISKTSARVLLASVVSNNLAFHSSLTTNRDKVAYEELVAVSELPSDWVASYFQEQGCILMADFASYVRADTKVFATPTGEFVMSQIEVWDADQLLKEKLDEIVSVLKGYEPKPWVVNIVDISKGHNYIFSQSTEGKRITSEKLNLVFEGDIAKTDALYLRKQLMQPLIK